MRISDKNYADIENFFKDIYVDEEVMLHRPIFAGNEKQYLIDCIDSNFVSSVGLRVTEFEVNISAFTGARFAVATMNGIAAPHIAIEMAGVTPESEVITQALTFIATCNAVAYCGAIPVFVDIERHANLS